MYLGLQVERNSLESISNASEILVDRFSCAWFPNLGIGKKTDVSK